MSLDALGELEAYWDAVRDLYAPFEMGLRSPSGTVYPHEIPGGQLSNLRQQAAELGLANRFAELEDLYARCNTLLGNLIKVTPTSKVVGDLALYLMSGGMDPAELERAPEGYDLPRSVLDFLLGDLGTPPGGWPEPFRERALSGRDATLDQLTLSDADLVTLVNSCGADRQALLSRLSFPGPAQAQAAAVMRFGDVSVVPTREFFYGLEAGEEVEVELERGVRLLIELEAIGESDDGGMRTVIMKLNGQVRPVDARDRAVEPEVAASETADAGNPRHVAAPLTRVVTLYVDVGDAVAPGQRVATVEAMKMESAITTGVGGTVERIAAVSGTQVQPGDLLLAIAAPVAPSAAQQR